MLTLEAINSRAIEIRENRNSVNISRSQRNRTRAEAALELAFREVGEEPPGGLEADNYNYSGSVGSSFGGVKLSTLSRVNGRYLWRAVSASNGAIDDETIREKARELAQMYDEYIERRQRERQRKQQQREQAEINRAELEKFAEESGFEISYGSWRMKNEDGSTEKWGNVKFDGDNVKVTAKGDTDFAKRLFAFIQTYG